MTTTDTTTDVVDAEPAPPAWETHRLPRTRDALLNDALRAPALVCC